MDDKSQISMGLFTYEGNLGILFGSFYLNLKEILLNISVFAGRHTRVG